jgi:hypothetical protein
LPFLSAGSTCAVGSCPATVLQRLLHDHGGKLEQIRFVTAERTVRHQLLLQQRDRLDVLTLLH